jgi:hypothetical protein
MKRSVVALGILGLVYAVAISDATAAVLLKDDFSTDALLKAKGTYIQGSNPQILSDPDNLVPFFVQDGVLDTVSSDGTTANGDPDNYPTVETLLLTGDPKWADVAIQANIRVPDQGTGEVSLVLRAAPKTKPADPDTWYEFRYTTGNSPVLQSEDASGIAAPDASPNLRLMKVVNGKWKMLAETDADRSTTPIPTVMSGGDNQETGAIFRFTAKGNLLQGFISLDGVKFDKFLSATDDELKAGLVGLDTYDYHPVFDDLLVEDAP